MIINIPDNWLPTSENINALPRPIRDYIMRLHANTDPAGELSRAMVAEMERDALRKMMEWQPIETAPKEEGFKILGASNQEWVQDYYPVLVYEGRRFGPNNKYFGWYAPFDHDDRAPDPTHWMPLPEAPDVGR